MKEFVSPDDNLLDIESKILNDDDGIQLKLFDDFNEVPEMEISFVEDMNDFTKSLFLSYKSRNSKAFLRSLDVVPKGCLMHHFKNKDYLYVGYAFNALLDETRDDESLSIIYQACYQPYYVYHREARNFFQCFEIWDEDKQKFLYIPRFIFYPDVKYKDKFDKIPFQIQRVLG